MDDQETTEERAARASASAVEERADHGREASADPRPSRDAGGGNEEDAPSSQEPGNSGGPRKQRGKQKPQNRKRPGQDSDSSPSDDAVSSRDHETSAPPQPETADTGNQKEQEPGEGGERHSGEDSRRQRERDDRRHQNQHGGGDGGHGARRKKRRKDRKHRKPEQQLGPPVHGEGLLEISGKGFGFLRQREHNFKPTPTDIFVTPEMVRTYELRDGLWIEGETREGPRGPQLTELQKINGKDPEKYRSLPIFEELTAVNPNKRLLLETDPKRFTTRVIDMMSPIGRGQRGLIVAPPRTGKTILLQHIAESVLQNHENMKLIMLLIDERPEEVTELTRALPGAEIMASSNDTDVKSHTRIAQLAIERAKRLVEAGEHVFILLDSITRLGRAFNNASKGGGRTMSGGMDINALEIPRRLFAAARNTREAGSLTIVATALIETGSKMDELIFQEFKGTGNMELVLDRKISERYIYPAVDIFRSGTRREELLLPPHQLEAIYVIRRGLSGHKPVEAIERLLHFCERFPSNAQMLLEIPKS